MPKQYTNIIFALLLLCITNDVSASLIKIDFSGNKTGYDNTPISVSLMFDADEYLTKQSNSNSATYRGTNWLNYTIYLGDEEYQLSSLNKFTPNNTRDSVTIGDNIRVNTTPPSFWDTLLFSSYNNQNERVGDVFVGSHSYSFIQFNSRLTDLFNSTELHELTNANFENSTYPLARGFYNIQQIEWDYITQKTLSNIPAMSGYFNVDHISICSEPSCFDPVTVDESKYLGLTAFLILFIVQLTRKTKTYRNQ